MQLWTSIFSLRMNIVNYSSYFDTDIMTCSYISCLQLFFSLYCFTWINDIFSFAYSIYDLEKIHGPMWRSRTFVLFMENDVTQLFGEMTSYSVCQGKVESVTIDFLSPRSRNWPYFISFPLANPHLSFRLSLLLRTSLLLAMYYIFSSCYSTPFFQTVAHFLLP